MPSDTPSERSLCINEAELQQRFDSPQQGMLSLDHNGDIRGANPVLCAYLGTTPNALEGRALASLGAAGTPALNSSAVEWLLQHGHLRRSDLPLRKADGVLRYLEFHRVGTWADHRVLFECRNSSRELDSMHAWPSHMATDTAHTAASNRQGILTAMELEALAAEEIQLARNLNRPLSLLSIGVDRSKCAGNGAAQELPLSLYAFAEACTGNLRDLDVVGRVDETIFVALMPGVATKGAQSAAERLRAAIAALDTPTSRGRKNRVTVSIGAVTTRTGLTSYRALRSRADAKRDDARNSGGNRVNA